MLSQSEIDALLLATAAAPAEPAGAAATEILPTALIAPGRSVRTYDFRHPDKFSKEQLRTLQAIHEDAGRVAGGRLTARLRGPVTVALANTEQLLFADYLEALELPTQLVVYRASGLAGSFLVDFDLGLAFAAVDRLLGGPGLIPAERREPTAIEADLIGRLVEELGPAFDEGWAHFQALGAAVEELALGPALLRVAAPTDVVAVITFEVRFAGQAAPLTVCYPAASLEPLLPRLAVSAWYEKTAARAAGEVREDVAHALETVEVPVRAVLGGVDLPVEALAGLQPGDVIRFTERADEPVRLSIMDQAQAWALPGRVGDRLALRVVTPLQPVEA